MNTNEAELRNIWSELLCIPIDAITTESNFFHLGGNSLAVVQLEFSIKQRFHVSLSISMLYSCPELKKQVALIEKALELPPS
ncbi:MAG: acyl carrier protein [Azoarcus sp.]|nr:acyl carrier protein [Azoarcus sp.]